MNFAHIILPLALKGPLSYRIPESLQQRVVEGSLVVLNLGKSKLYTGIVASLCDTPVDGFTIKEIVSVYDSPPITREQLRLWEWMGSYYCCTLGEIMKAALPAGLRPDSESRYTLSRYCNDFHLLSDEQKIVLQALDKHKKTALADLIKKTGIKNPLPTLKYLIEAGYASSGHFLSNSYKPLIRKYVRITVSNHSQAHEALDNLKRSPQQLQYFEFLLEQANENYTDFSIALNDSMQATQATGAVVNALQKKKLITIETREENRLEPCTEVSGLKTLSPEQQNCFNTIQNLHSHHDVVLLHGVASSGKTEIYLKHIAQVLGSGMSALYLLPEIAITTQIISRIQAAFGSKVGVYHSKFSDNEKVEVWKRVNSGSFQVIVGVRSAVFLPFRKLGLVVIDEEHENTYKQHDPAPRYHARDVAIVLAKQHGAKVILGSATPSLESWYNCQNNKYGLCELTERFGKAASPEIIVADMLKARKRKVVQLHFHPLLIDEIRTALLAKEQVILFQNRRGYAPYLQCTECAYVPKCDQCNVSLTYHKNQKLMLCHYCANKKPLLHSCPSCGSSSLKTMGFGTEMIEDEAGHFFQEARIARLDFDTATTRRQYESILSDFSAGKTDILIGTQMISKGLDFENVAVVGVLNADNMLNFPDFRAFERSFQLMVQVSGRAGRKNKRGKVIIQTTMPDHDIIEDIVKSDYQHMAEAELLLRKNFKYPPYYRFIGIRLKHHDKRILHQAAAEMASTISNAMPGRVMGPQEPPVNWVQMMYITHIVIRFENALSAVKLKTYLLDLKENISKDTRYKGIHIILDVDPM